MAAAGPLILVTVDRDDVIVRRIGRFSVTKDQAKSRKWMVAAIAAAQEDFIKGIESKGFRYTGKPFVLDGPFHHMEFDTSTEPDDGPDGMPDPTPQNLDALLAWSERDRRRVARKEQAHESLVDYTLTTEFAIKSAAYKKVLGGSAVWTP